MDDLKYWNMHQIVDCFLDESLKHECRVIHSCDNDELRRHPSWMMEQYVASGRAKQWADNNPKRRD